MSEHGSESENPVIDAPEPEGRIGRARTRTGGPTSWTSRCCTSTRREATRWARTSTTPRQFAQLDVEALKRDVVEVMTDLAGLVAGRLRPLRRRCSSG